MSSEKKSWHQPWLAKSQQDSAIVYRSLIFWITAPQRFGNPKSKSDWDSFVLFSLQLPFTFFLWQCSTSLHILRKNINVYKETWNTHTHTYWQIRPFQGQKLRYKPQSKWVQNLPSLVVNRPSKTGSGAKRKRKEEVNAKWNRCQKALIGSAWCMRDLVASCNEAGGNLVECMVYSVQSSDENTSFCPVSLDLEGICWSARNIQNTDFR